MSGYETILKIRHLEKECDDLGFMLCRSKYGHGRLDGLDVLALKPKDEASLPVYSRDAELFCGTIDQLEMWLRGVDWARQYDRFLFGIKHDRARERKEVDERARQVAAILKNGVECQALNAK